MAVLYINGVAVKDPATLQYAIQDIDSDTAGRNANGEMIRDRVATKRKISCSWSGLENEEIRLLLNSMTNEFFRLDFPDAMMGGIGSGTFYVGDRTAPLYMWNEKENKYLWEGLQANFIER